MKKILSITFVVLMLVSVFCLTAFADETSATADVYVTIADHNGKLVLTQEKITVTDKDGDGKLTIDEALFAAHEAKYEGGAAVGYASAETEYGLSMIKLWNDANGSFGYYVNNASAWSLADPVTDGDYVNAFVYRSDDFSDKYSFFDQNTVSGKEGDEITLTLFYAGYDEAWNPVTLPVEGATITVDGVASEYKTDAEGKVTVKLDKAGDVIISAESGSMTLVPPVCKADVEATAAYNNPSVAVIVCIAVAVVIGVVVIVLVIRKKKNEK